MQCTSNAYLAIIFSAIKNIGLWKSHDLDYILDQGDRIFKSVGINQPLAVDELPLNLAVEGASASVTMLARESSLFSETNEPFKNFRQDSDRDRGSGAIFTCGGFSVATIWV